MNAKEMFEEIYNKAMAVNCFDEALQAAIHLCAIEADEKAALAKQEDEEL